MSEVRLAFRRLRRRPGRTFVGVVTLALGIGASTAAFSAVQGVLISPLPVAEQDDLIVLHHENPARDFAHVPYRPDAVYALRDGADFGQVAGFDIVVGSAIGEVGDDRFQLRLTHVAGDFFGVLGARPANGRLLDATDDEVGAEPVVVVSHEYWVQRAGADPDLVGTSLRFRERTFTIVGITEAGFAFPRETQVWATLRGSHADWSGDAPIFEQDIVVRLAPGVTAADAAARTRLLFSTRADLARVYGAQDPVATQFLEHVVGPFESVLGAGMAVAVILLLVAIANATLLFLSGGTRAAREVAARRALGADRWRVIAPLLAEAGLLGACGTLLGIVLAWLIVGALLPLAPADLPRLDQVGLDWSSLTFAALAALLAMIGSGGVAGLWLSRGEARDALASAGRGFGLGGEGLRRAIAGTQVAFAVVAAVGAGLLARTVDNLGGLDRGFEVSDLYLVGIEHGHALFEVPEAYVRELADVAAILSASPEIAGATPTINYPLIFNRGLEIAPTLEGQEDEEARGNPYVSLDAVLPEYFGVLGMELREGRLLEADDGATSERVVVLNETAARLLWPGQRVIGRQLKIYPGQVTEWGTVVGVVADSRYRSFPELRPAAYVSLPQYFDVPPGLLLVRTNGDGGSARALVANALTETAPAVRVTTVDRMEDLMSGPMLLPRFAAAVLLTSAFVTLLLTGLGVYGVFTVMVQERARSWACAARWALRTATSFSSS